MLSFKTQVFHQCLESTHSQPGYHQPAYWPHTKAAPGRVLLSTDANLDLNEVSWSLEIARWSIMQQYVVQSEDAWQHNEEQLAHVHSRIIDSGRTTREPVGRYESPRQSFQVLQKPPTKQSPLKLMSRAPQLRNRPSPTANLQVHSLHGIRKSRTIQSLEDGSPVREANSTFRSAANRLALATISPNAGRSSQQASNTVQEYHGNRHALKYENLKETKPTLTKQTPRKLLWPNIELPSPQYVGRTVPTYGFRQKFGSPRKPEASYRVHRSPQGGSAIMPSLSTNDRFNRPASEAGSFAHRWRPQHVPNVTLNGFPRSQPRLKVRNETFHDPASRPAVRLEHMTQMLPLHLRTHEPSHLPITDGGPLPLQEEQPLDPLSTRTDAIANSLPIASSEVIEKTTADLRFFAARILPSWQVWGFRILFGTLVLCLNASLLIAYFYTDRHLYLLAILAFVKSKDLLCTITDMVGLSYATLKHVVKPPEKVPTKWIASLVCAYAESEEQIMKTFSSLAKQDLKQHRQVVCIILDGKNADILSRFTKVNHRLNRTYFTWKGSTGELVIYSGFIGDTATILVRKIRNAGKKDSLILGHDMFNFPRSDMPSDTAKLRREIYSRLLPSFNEGEPVSAFDVVFCTDADSIIHSHSLQNLTDTLSRQQSAIAACGILVAELTAPKLEWTAWHLYQQFQYTFGQYVRRQAEGIWGRVTCLPGCITMIKVRPEMGSAISMYAKPVTNYNVLEHQVQYLGTDRRLTYCILAQGKHLKSLFVPGALCETVVPNSLEHYLSQRRRWASNAYFNDYYYAGGQHQLAISRLIAVIDIARQTLVFYRVINTGLFLYSLFRRFYIIKIVPTLILTKAPAIWFILVILGREKILRQRIHKLFLGMCINQMISPFLSVIVFANVLLNVGSQVWGTTGVSSLDPRHPATPYTAFVPPPVWSPGRLASVVRNAIRGAGSQSRSHSHIPETPSHKHKPSTERQRAESWPVTPGSQETLAMAHPNSALRYRSTVLSPFRHTADD